MVLTSFLHLTIHPYVICPHKITPLRQVLLSNLPPLYQVSQWQSIYHQESRGQELRGEAGCTSRCRKLNIGHPVVLDGHACIIWLLAHRRSCKKMCGFSVYQLFPSNLPAAGVMQVMGYIFLEVSLDTAMQGKKTNITIMGNNIPFLFKKLTLKIKSIDYKKQQRPNRKKKYNYSPHT